MEVAGTKISPAELNGLPYKIPRHPADNPGQAEPRRGDGSIVVFSPFGLGVLDLALAKVVYEHAVEQGVGEVIDSFLPKSWGASA